MVANEGCWLVGILVVTACSWARLLSTGSLKVDENYPSGPFATALFVVLVLGWGLMVTGWRGFLAQPPRSPRRLAFAGLLLAAFMLPMISNDVFSILAYGSLAARGRDVYTSAASLPESVWYFWIGERWNAKVCVYGPSTLVALLPAALAGRSPWLALALLRLAWFVPLAIVMELSLRRLRDQPFFHTMVWLNPLFVLEGVGQLHADLLGLAAIVAGILLQRSGRVTGAWLSFAVAVLGKVSFAFAGPWFWLSGARTFRQRALRIAPMTATVLGVAVLFFVPFWRGPSTLLEPIKALAAMNPGGSITEVAGHLVHLARGGEMAGADVPVQMAVEFDRATKGGTWLVVSLVLRAICLGIGVRVGLAMLRRPHDDDAIALGTGVLIVAAVTLASHRFQSWYLLAALPFFGLRCTEIWRRWWLAAVAMSVAPQFVFVLPRSSTILPVWTAVTTAGVMVVFVMSFRSRFFGDLREATAQRALGPVSSRPAIALAAAPADSSARLGGG